MILTDREWLRFVTFGIVAGAVLGALYTAALITRGHPLVWATAFGIAGSGVLAAIVHVAVRILLDRATDPATGSTDTETSDTTDS